MIKSLLLAGFISLGLASSSLSNDVIIEGEWPADPCISREQVFDDMFTSGLTDLMFTEIGNTVIFSSPTRDTDFLVKFNDDKCMVYSAIIKEKPTT